MNWHYNWSEKQDIHGISAQKPHASLNLLLDPRFAIIIQVPCGHLWGPGGLGVGEEWKGVGGSTRLNPPKNGWWQYYTRSDQSFFLFPPNFWHLGIAMELWWNLACDSLPFHSWIQCSFSRFLHSSRLNKAIAIRPCNQVLSPSEQYRYVHYNVYIYIHIYMQKKILYCILCITNRMLRSAWYASLRASYTSLCLH